MRCVSNGCTHASTSIFSAAVVKHFDDFQEDQFDFHAYCIRKVTLRAYTEVLRFEDNIWSENYYFTAADGIIRIYLHLYDNPSILQEDKEPDYSTMSAAERKKAKAVARKKRAQAEKKAAEKKKAEAEDNDGNNNNNSNKKKAKSSPMDEDPEGKELLKLDPLGEAKKYSAILSKHCPSRLATWAIQYDVAIRRKKWLLALQALFKMRQLDEFHGDFFSRTVDFSLRICTFGEQNGVVATVLNEEFPNLLHGKSIKEFVAEAAAKIRSDPLASLPYRVAVTQGLVKTELEPVSAAAQLILQGGISSKGVTVESCGAALKALKALGAEAEPALNQWTTLVKDRFPLASDLS